MNQSYLDSSRSPEERTEILLKQMTLEEKAGQLMQITCMKADPEFKDGKAVGWIYSRISEQERYVWVVEKHAGSFLHVLGDEIQLIQELATSNRLGIPVLFGIDAIHGHALHNGATVFPSQLAVSSSWDIEGVQTMGRVTAREVAADGIHWTFSPVLCVARDMRWGRVNETFGEDPYLIGELGAAIIKGYQGKSLSDEGSILACAKHYLAYGESTGGRDSYDASVSHRKLREVFLPPFKRAVEAGCSTVMTGYQSIDGTPITISKRWVQQVLKNELGFDGFVVTDWNNAESLVTQQKVASSLREAVKMTLMAGNDLFMNTPGAYELLIDLVNSGELPVEALDEAVRRVLKIKFRLGLFEKVLKNGLENSVHTKLDETSHAHQANLELTRKSMVLLENKHQTLPLAKTVKKVAVIGPNAHDLKAQYGDWTFFSHPFPKDEMPEKPYYTMLEGITEVASRYGVDVNYDKGCHIIDPTDHSIDAAVALSITSDVIIAVVGDCLDQNGEFKDRGDLSLSGAQQQLLEALKATGKPLIVVLVNGKPLAIPWVKTNTDAVIETFNSGMFGGLVVGEILFGDTVPSGKLSISFPYHTGQLPVYYNQLPGWHGSKYMDLPMDPLYPFGYGLSFTSFTYSNLKLSKTTCSAEDELFVSVTVTNRGKVDAEEIVQLYVNDVVSSVMTPFKQLKGFKRQLIRAGETCQVEICLSISSLSLIDENEVERVEPGDFIIMVGPDSRDSSLLKAELKVV